MPLKGVELFWAPEGQQHEYDYLRMMNGIPEGQLEMPYDKQVPLEANIQNMNGINFNKVRFLKINVCLNLFAHK